MCMLHAEFAGLKDELERLLCRNRGLTRASSPRTAAESASTSDSSRSCSDRDRDSSVHSRHSSTHSQSSSCSSFSGMWLGQTNQPSSVAERASQQLSHDVDILLKQVDDVMAAPVLQLPAWFTKKPAAPSCTVTELPEAHQTPPAAHTTHRIVTPKLKATSVSTADSRTSACQDIMAATDTASSAAQHQHTKACSAPSAALKPAQCTAAGQGTGKRLSSTSAAADNKLASEPDNLTILHVACATTPSQSGDTATTIRSGHQGHTGTLPSPKEWHTNHMANSDGSVSSTGDSTRPAAAWPADSSPGDAGHSVMHAARSSRRRHGSQDTSKGQPHRSKTSKGRQAPGGNHPNSPGSRNQDELTDHEHDSEDELHMENVAPGWHRQPLRNLRNSDAVSAKLAPPEGSAEAEGARGSAGQGGLMEGYLRGSSAKLQLPAAVRCGSRKSAITARTPLKTITEVYRQHSMERFDIDRPQLVRQAAAKQPLAETKHASTTTPADTASEALPPLDRPRIAKRAHALEAACGPSEDRASYSALASEGRASAGALPLESSMHAWGMACGRGGGIMAEGVEGLQAVLQDNSSALQQELRTAEAKMEAMLSQLTSGRSGAVAQGAPSSRISEGAGITEVQQQLASAERHVEQLSERAQQLEAQVTQLTLDLQRSSSLLSRSEEDLQCKSDQLHQAQRQLQNCMTPPSAAEQQLQSSSVQESQTHMFQQLTDRQQQQSNMASAAASAAASASEMSHVEAAAAAEEEAEMLREKLHDSVELLEEADRQLKLKVAEVDDCRAELSISQQELQQTRLQLQEVQALLEEHAELLQQHNVQLLQAQGELEVSQSRSKDMEEEQQAAAERHAEREGHLRNAMERLQLVAQQSHAEGGAARGGLDGRLQAAQARCDRAEARLTTQQAKTQQVSGQLAGKCAELMQSQSELRQAHHMLAAAYAANAALQVRFQHRGRKSIDHSPDQPPATPLAPSISGSPHESSAVTPAASLQAPGSGSNPLMSAKGSSLQPLLAAALARAVAGNSPSPPHSTTSGAVAGNSPAGTPILMPSASKTPKLSSPHSRASLRPIKGVTQEAAAAANNLTTPGNASLSSGERSAARGWQEDGTSSASFDSWHSKNGEGSNTSAYTSQPADATAVGLSKTSIAAAAVDARAEKAKVRQRKARHTQQVLAQVQQACLTPGSVHSSTRGRQGAHTPGGSWSDLYGQERSPRNQQLTPGRPATALTPPATQSMWGSTLELTLASQQGSTGPSHFVRDNSNVAQGVAALRGANATVPISQAGMHVSRSRKASRMGVDTTTALANALSGIRNHYGGGAQART